MTREEAITYLNDFNLSRKYDNDSWEIDPEMYEALDMAITALQAQDIDEKIMYMERLNGGADYHEPMLRLSEAMQKQKAQGVDAVSRQAVMWMLTNLSYTQCRTQGEVEVIGLAKTMLIAMPSAQSEIIHCRECVYGEQIDYWWYCSAFGCQVGDEDGSGFCANAERRADGFD